MEFIRKIIVWLFTVITALGLNPQTIPKEINLPALTEDRILYTVSELSFAYDKGSFSVALEGRTMFSDAISEYRTAEGETVSSLDYENA